MSIVVALGFIATCTALGIGIGEGLFRLIDRRARRRREVTS